MGQPGWTCEREPASLVLTLCREPGVGAWPWEDVPRKREKREPRETEGHQACGGQVTGSEGCSSHLSDPHSPKRGAVHAWHTAHARERTMQVLSAAVNAACAAERRHASRRGLFRGALQLGLLLHLPAVSTVVAVAVSAYVRGASQLTAPVVVGALVGPLPSHRHWLA